MSSTEFPTRNFLVPASGGTRTVKTSFLATAAPYVINWDQFSVDNSKFYPQGAYVDNIDGANDLVIMIRPTGQRIIVGAGKTRAVTFVAPRNGQICEITGDGEVSIFWCDFPVFPDGDESSGSSSNPQYVRLSSDELPLPVTTPAPIDVNVSPFARVGPTHYLEVTDSSSVAIEISAPQFRVVNDSEYPVALLVADVSPDPAVYPAPGDSADEIIMAPHSTEVFSFPSETYYLRAIRPIGGDGALYVCGGIGA